MFQIRERSQVKNPRELASYSDKMNGKLEKIWREPELLAPQNSSFYVMFKKTSRKARAVSFLNGFKNTPGEKPVSREFITIMLL